MLYEIYGVNFRPEEHISYPKIIKKKTDLQEEVAQTAKKEKRACTTDKILKKINYPQVNHEKFERPAKVDLIKKRKPQAVIEMEIKQIKKESKQIRDNPTKDRKQEIEKLQNNFQYMENKNLPKKARPPVVKLDETNNEEAFQKINMINEVNGNKYQLKTSREKKGSTDEISKLHDAIMKEINERYAYLEELKQAGDSKGELVIMNEIKDRIKELRTLESLRK